MTIRKTTQASQAVAANTAGQRGMGGESPTGTVGSSQFTRVFFLLSVSAGTSTPALHGVKLYGFAEATSTVTGISKRSLPATLVAIRSVA